MNNKNKNLFFTLFLIIMPIFTSWNYELSGQDWPQSCFNSNQAPINIDSPFTYKNFTLSLHFDDSMSESYLYHDNNNLKLIGDFGYVEFEGEIYTSSEIIFYHQSLHSFKSQKYPLELQIVTNNGNDHQLIIVVFFQESKEEYNPLLGKIGFDKEDMKNMIPLYKKIIDKKIDLNELFENNPNFFYYEATDPIPPCMKQTKFFIMPDILDVNTEQLNNFPLMLKDKFRSIQERGKRNIFINIDANELEQKMIKKQQIMDIEQKEEEQFKQKLKIYEKQISKSNKQEQNENIQRTESLETLTPIRDVKKQLKILNKYNKIKELHIFKNDKKEMSDGDALVIMDKILPKTQGEVEGVILRQKFEEWLELYTKFKNGEEFNTENDKKIALYKMSLLQKELTHKNYIPMINYLNKKQSHQNLFSYIETQFKIEHKQIELSEIAKKFLEEEIAQNEKHSPYRQYFTLESETIEAQGRIPKSEKNEKNNDIFDVSSFPIDCKRAKYKSPINIYKDILSNKDTVYKKDLFFNFISPTDNIYINNDDYKLIITTASNFGTVSYKEHQYDIKKYLIHSPSEHTLGKDEVRTPFELQIICNDMFDNTIAISLLFQYGNRNFELFDIIGLNADKKENFLYSKKLRNNEKIEITSSSYIKEAMNLGKLFNDNLTFITYIGTTTTPPCKSNVRWFICLNKFETTKEQVDMFPVLFGRFKNVRGLQQLNKRKINLMK